MRRSSTTVQCSADQSRLAEHFIEFVHAKQSLYRDIVVGLENGWGDVFAPLRSTVSRLPGTPRGGRTDDYSRLAARRFCAFRIAWRWKFSGAL